MEMEMNTSAMERERTPDQRPGGERARRACDNCWKSKSKCRPGKQSCENCRFDNIPCTYTRTVKKRGPPKGYMRSMEDRLADLEAMIKAQKQEQDRSPSDTSTAVSQAETNKTSPAASNVLASEQASQNVSHARSTSRSETTHDISSSLGQLSIDENFTMRYHGAASGLQLITSSTRFTEPFWNFPNPGYWPRTSSKIVMTEDEILCEADATDGPVLPSIELQDQLLEAFWTHIHPHFPVLHQSFFVAQLSSDRKGIPLLGKASLDQIRRRIPQVLLLAIFALGARFVERQDREDKSDLGDTYAARAEVLLARHKQSTQRSCITLLLMAYREIGTGGSISWMYVGNAIRMAQDLGLHRDPNAWKVLHPFAEMSPVEVEIRRRIWWATMIIDKHASALFGRPSGIMERSYDTQLPYWFYGDCAAECFNQTAKLSVISGLILNDLYSIPSRPLDRSDLAKYEGKLADWEMNLPPIVQLHNGVEEVTLPEVITMYAQLWNCRILLNRPFMSNEKNIGDEWQLRNASDLAATSAAVAISNLVAFYTSHHDFNSCSPFFTYYLLSAAIVLISSRKNCPVMFNATALEQCETALEAMSKTWSGAARTLEIIRGVSGRNQQAENSVEMQQGQIPISGLDIDLQPFEGWNGYYDQEDFAFENVHSYI